MAGQTTHMIKMQLQMLMITDFTNNYYTENITCLALHTTFSCRTAILQSAAHEVFQFRCHWRRSMHKTIRIIVSISGLISLDAVFHSPPSVYGFNSTRGQCSYFFNV